MYLTRNCLLQRTTNIVQTDSLTPIVTHWAAAAASKKGEATMQHHWTGKLTEVPSVADAAHREECQDNHSQFQHLFGLKLKVL